MKVQCAQCGAELERANPTTHCFCCAEHRNEWMRQNVDFAAMSRGHKAKHLTNLNAERNPHCRVVDGGLYDIVMNDVFHFKLPPMIEITSSPLEDDVIMEHEVKTRIKRI